VCLAGCVSKEQLAQRRKDEVAVRAKQEAHDQAMSLWVLGYKYGFDSHSVVIVHKRTGQQWELDGNWEFEYHPIGCDRLIVTSGGAAWVLDAAPPKNEFGDFGLCEICGGIYEHVPYSDGYP
jgi:hypothetical protein